MNPFEKIYDVDLKEGIKRSIDLGVLLFEGDNNSYKIGSNVYDDHTPVTFSGTITGKVIRHDGAMVEVTGAIDGNTGYIILPEAVFAVPGPVEITIKNISNGDKITIGHFTAIVKRTETGAIVDPGTVIPDVDDLLALIDSTTDAKDAANTAAQNANAAASHSVRYDVNESSTRTASEKAIARGNIGAVAVTIENHTMVIS